MAIPKSSYAADCYRHSLGSHDSREAVITEIAGLDRVPREEAERRYDEAEAQYRRRGIAQQSRGERQRRAIETLQWSVLCKLEAAYRQAPKGRDQVPIDEALLGWLAAEYQRLARAKFVPDPAWIEDKCIEQLYRDGLITRGTSAMRITAAGLAHIEGTAGGDKG